MKKRALALFLALACLLSLWPVLGLSPTTVQAAEGIPDILLYEKYPNAKEFQISTPEGLQKFSSLGQSSNLSGKTFYQICDIDMSGFSYIPPVTFAGVYDGGFHAIKALSVTTSDLNCGFVGKLISGGVLRNLGIEGGVFTATCSKDSWRAGCLAGVVDRSTVENCWSTSSITISGGYDYLSVGGIVGGIHNGGMIKNCYFGGIATGINVAAGICGWGQGHYEGYVGQIYNCYNMGQLVATTKYAIGRYSDKILDSNKSNAMNNNYYFDSTYTDYTWSNGDTLVSKGQIGSGYLAYALNSKTALGNAPVWSQGALFPELRKTAGVYPLSVTYVCKGKNSTATLYLNAGDTYTVGVPDSVSASLTANAGTVNGRNFIMPSKAATITVTVDAANIADHSTYPNESVYVVTNRAGFTALATAVNGGKTFSGKSFYMLGDIDMTNTKHTPIGLFDTNSSWTTSFSGKFYGNNFKILNLYVYDTALNDAGLFGSCYKAYFNGLTIFNGSVTCANRAAGITGYADACTFEYCMNGASIKSTTGSDGIGGLAGVARISSVFNYCGNFGTVTATKNGAAGIAGWGQDNVKMTGCFNTGIINATDDVGAFARVKAGYTPEFKDCYYLNTACATSVAGSATNVQRFRVGIVASYINTSYRTTTSNGAFTATPVIPAVCSQNQQPAICTRLYAYEDGINLGYQTICANLGDDLPYTTALNYYSSVPFSAPDALTSKAYPTGLPFSITYVANGGTWKANGASSYTRACGVGLPDGSMIEKNGYVFAGWFAQSNFAGQPLALITPETTGDKTLYAKWVSPVEISTVEEYLAFAKAVNNGNSHSDKYVFLSADLDFGGQTIPAIGTASAPFMGVLDGKGYSLSNFTISGDNAQGLVGYLKQGTVKFLVVENATVSGNTNTGSVVGINQSGLVMGCMSSAQVKSTWTTFEYSLMSQNVRYGSDASPNSTEERIPRMKTFLQNYAPDIIGFQEYDATWKTAVESVLTGYGKQCVFSNTTAKNAGSPLYWNSNKFVALEKGTFWLSETPDKMSLGWGAEHYRSCSYAVLRVKSNGMIVIAANTHLDHKVAAAQINGMKLIMERMNALKATYAAKGYNEIYFHITVDFNVDASNVVIKDLSKHLTEARYAAVTLGTPVNQNSFSAYSASPTRLIDYMFVSNNTDVTYYKVALDKINGNAISDHYGLYGTIRIGGNSHGGIAGENNGVILSCAYTGSITSEAGTSGIAAENNGNILNSYSQYTASATGVPANAITTKYSCGRVDFCYYQSGTGLSGAGSTVSNLKATDVPGKLNRLVSLWVRKDGVNNGLPFICLKHEYTYTDSGNGEHTGTCSLCGASLTEAHSPVTDEAVAPNCTTAGKTEGSHCVLCNAVITGQETIPATGHSYTSKVTTVPTCTDEGVKTFACSTCNHSYTETLSATGHTVVADKAVAPTCTATGLTEGSHCSVCNTVIVAQETVPAKGHSYTSKVTTTPSCTAEGVKTFTCSACSHSYTETLSATGHTVVTDKAVAPTCTETGLTAGSHCTVCGETLTQQEVIPATGHSYTYNKVDSTSHSVTCDLCDYAEEVPHSYTEGFCICGEAEVKEPILNADLKLYHSLNLASNISVNFAIPAAYLDGFDMDTVYVETRYYDYVGNEQEEEKIIRISPVLNGYYYYFTLEGLTAIHMTNELTSVLYGTKDGQPYYSPVDEYSIATYAYSQLTSSTVAPKLKTLCAELLRYGALAQSYKGYRTDHPADLNMTEEHKALLGDLNAVTFANVNATGSELSKPTVSWIGKSLDLNSKVTVLYVINTTSYTGKVEDLTLKVSYLNRNGEEVTVTLKDPKSYGNTGVTYAFYLDELLAAELRAVLTAQVYAGNTPVSNTLTYTADTYGNNKTGALGELCKALFAYSDAAKAYFAN